MSRIWEWELERAEEAVVGRVGPGSTGLWVGLDDGGDRQGPLSGHPAQAESGGKFSPTAWGEMRWQKRALKRMRTSGKVTQTRNCRGRLGRICE